MYIIRVDNKSASIFNKILSNRKISNIVITISQGSTGNYGPYINQNVAVYGISCSSSQSFQDIENDVKADPTASQSYKSFSKNEFYF